MNYSKKSYSHQGQDLILLDLFRNYRKGVFIEIGCNHPKKESNTYLLYKLGWTGYCVDAESSFEKEWIKYRKRDRFIHGAIANEKKGGRVTFFQFENNTMSTTDKKTMEGYTEKYGEPVATVNVDTITVEDIIVKYNIPRNYELLCVDIEGKDLDALKSAKLNLFRPKVILVEIKLHNFYKPNNSEIYTFLYDNDYIMIAKTPLDGIFIDRNENLGWIPKPMINIQ